MIPALMYSALPSVILMRNDPRFAQEKTEAAGGEAVTPKLINSSPGIHARVSSNLTLRYSIS